MMHLCKEQELFFKMPECIARMFFKCHLKMPELAGQHVRGCRKPWDLGFMATKDTTKTNPAGEFMKPLSRETTNSFVHQAED